MNYKFLLLLMLTTAFSCNTQNKESTENEEETLTDKVNDTEKVKDTQQTLAEKDYDALAKEIEVEKEKLENEKEKLMVVYYYSRGPFSGKTQTWYLDESFKVKFLEADGGDEGGNGYELFASYNNIGLATYSHLESTAEDDFTTTLWASSLNKKVMASGAWEMVEEESVTVPSNFEYLEKDMISVPDYKQLLSDLKLSAKDFTFDKTYLFSNSGGEGEIEFSEDFESVELRIDSLLFVNLFRLQHAEKE